MNNWTEWLGKTQTIEAVISAETANLMQVTLNRDPSFKNGDTLPPAWHWLYFHEPIRADKLGVEGHAALGQFMPPISFDGGLTPPRRMWAGGSFQFSRPIRIGDRASKRSTIQSITPKAGRSGKLVFVVVEHDVLAAGERCLLEEQTIVYREPVKASGGGGKGELVAGGEFSAEYDPTPIMLFRYSALTFNSHRIHYDADFCRDHEGYPNLVVHGPLTATLLLDLFYHRYPNKPIRAFSYRGHSPLFVPNRFAVHGNADGYAWVMDHEGRLAMRAQLSY